MPNKNIEKMIDFFSRLDIFMKHKGLNDNKISVQASISNGLIGKARTRGGLSGENISKILNTFSDLNANWLFTGKGKMLRKEDGYDPKSGNPNEIISIFLEKDKELTEKNGELRERIGILETENKVLRVENEKLKEKETEIENLKAEIENLKADNEGLKISARKKSIDMVDLGLDVKDRELEIG